MLADNQEKDFEYRQFVTYQKPKQTASFWSLFRTKIYIFSGSIE